MEIVNFVQEWSSVNVKPPIKVVGSLALQMTQRAMDEEKASRVFYSSGVSSSYYHVRPGNNAKLRISNVKKSEQRERSKSSKPRSKKTPCASFWPGRNSKPATGRFQNQQLYPLRGILTETFNNEIRVNDLRFTTVKLFHPRNGTVGFPSFGDFLK